MTAQISLVAVCCSSASVSSRLRASSSVNSRTFSMAMTAWSAKVWSSAICLSVNGSDLASATARSRRWRALAEQRHGQRRRGNPTCARCAAIGYSGSAGRSCDVDRPAGRGSARPVIDPGRRHRIRAADVSTHRRTARECATSWISLAVDR